MYKIFETNCSFHVKDPTTGKVQFLFFRTFLPISTKSSFWEEDWALGYNSMKFWYFLGISFFPKIRNLTLFVNSKDNLYMPCLLLIITFRFSCGEKENFVKLQKVAKYYNHDCRFYVVHKFTKIHWNLCIRFNKFSFYSSCLRDSFLSFLFHSKSLCGCG